MKLLLSARGIVRLAADLQPAAKADRQRLRMTAQDDGFVLMRTFEAPHWRSWRWRTRQRLPNTVLGGNLCHESGSSPMPVTNITKEERPLQVQL
jgi:hypothetical protein